MPNYRAHTLFGFLLAALLAGVVTACVPVTAPATSVELGDAATPAKSSTTEDPAVANPDADSLAVGIVLPSQYVYWTRNAAQLAEQLAAANLSTEILYSQESSATEKTNVETLLAKGAKVILITPVDGEAAAAAAETAKAGGAHVIAYDRLIRGTDAVDFYVAFDNNAVGAAQAQYLVDAATGAGNPLYLYAGATFDNNAFQFFEGAWSVLQPKIADGTFVVENSSAAADFQGHATLTSGEMAEILDQITTNWDLYDAESMALADLESAPPDGKDKVFVLAPNDGIARTIAKVFADDPNVTSYVITGQDGDRESIQFIIDGMQSMTVLKDVRKLAAMAVGAASAFVDGQAPPTTATFNNGVIDVPANPAAVTVVDRTNVKDAIIDSGYYPAGDFTGLD